MSSHPLRAISPKYAWEGHTCSKSMIESMFIEQLLPPVVPFCYQVGNIKSSYTNSIILITILANIAYLYKRLEYYVIIS